MRFKPANGVLVVQRWNRVQAFKARPPQAWAKTAERPRWSPNRGDDQLLCLGQAIRKVRVYQRRQRQAVAAGTPEKRPFDLETECLARFVELIDPTIRGRLYTLTARSWQLYSLLYRCTGALELARNNLGLAYALANHWVFTRKPPKDAMRVARRVLRLRRREIAGFLGFPETNAAARVLGRVRGRDLNVFRLMWLQQAMCEPRMMRILSHLDRVEIGVLEALGAEASPTRCSGRLMNELAAMTPGRGERVGFSVAGLFVLCRQLDLPLPRLRCAKQAEHLYDELFLETVRSVGPPNDRPLGEPPVPGVPGVIEPLTTTRQIHREGRLQRNCLADGHGWAECQSGTRFIYRMLEPDRCTLALRRAGGRWSPESWTLFDFKGPQNSAPSDAAWATVDAWLSRAGIERTKGCTADEVFEPGFADDLIPI